MAADFDLIIFDCDGTLTDSEAVNNIAFLEVLHAAGFTEYTLDHAYKNWVGVALSSTILAIQAETGRPVPETVVNDYMRRVAELQITGLIPIEGAPQLVAKSKDKFKICVASNGERSNVLESLKITKLMDYFSEDKVFTKVQVKNPKPYPDLFLFAAQTMDADPVRCLVIEDSTAGVRAGVAAGMTVWGYAGSAHDPQKQEEYLKAAGATAVFHSLIHIESQLGL